MKLRLLWESAISILFLFSCVIHSWYVLPKAIGPRHLVKMGGKPRVIAGIYCFSSLWLLKSNKFIKIYPISDIVVLFNLSIVSRGNFFYPCNGFSL